MDLHVLVQAIAEDELVGQGQAVCFHRMVGLSCIGQSSLDGSAWDCLEAGGGGERQGDLLRNDTTPHPLDENRRPSFHYDPTEPSDLYQQESVWTASFLPTGFMRTETHDPSPILGLVHPPRPSVGEERSVRERRREELTHGVRTALFRIVQTDDKSGGMRCIR